MRYLNLTPHAIVVRLPSGDRTFAPSGAVARVSSTPGEALGGDVPTYSAPVWGAVEGLPEPQEGVVYIVSGLVAGRVSREDVVSPGTGPADGAIREEGRIVAVTRFVRST